MTGVTFRYSRQRLKLDNNITGEFSKFSIQIDKTLKFGIELN